MREVGGTVRGKEAEGDVASNEKGAVYHEHNTPLGNGVVSTDDDDEKGLDEEGQTFDELDRRQDEVCVLSARLIQRKILQSPGNKRGAFVEAATDESRRDFDYEKNHYGQNARLLGDEAEDKEEEAGHHEGDRVEDDHLCSLREEPVGFLGLFPY